MKTTKKEEQFKQAVEALRSGVPHVSEHFQSGYSHSAIFGTSEGVLTIELISFRGGVLTIKACAWKYKKWIERYVLRPHSLTFLKRSKELVTTNSHHALSFYYNENGERVHFFVPKDILPFCVESVKADGTVRIYLPFGMMKAE